MNGDTLWKRTYDDGLGQNDEANSIIVDNLQNVYITGSTDNTSTGFDFLTIKYNLNGDVNWIKK